MRATQTATANDFILPLRALCTGQADGVAGATTYAKTPGVRPLIAFRTLNAASYNRDTPIGTDDGAADALGEAQLVACQEESPVSIGDCAYTSESTGTKRTVYRMQHQVKIRPLSAKTGQVFANDTLLGTEPRECMDTETFSSGATSMTLSGDSVPVSEIQAWLRPHVAP